MTPATLTPTLERPAAIRCDVCKQPRDLALIHREDDDQIICWQCVRDHWQFANETFTFRKVREMQERMIADGKGGTKPDPVADWCVADYQASRADYCAVILAHTEPEFWLARAHWNVLGVDWRRDVCPECGRPAELADPERPCYACRVDELERLRGPWFQDSDVCAEWSAATSEEDVTREVA